MSPAKSRDHPSARRCEIINGACPSPLKINNGSHLIQKPSSHSSSSSSSSNIQPSSTSSYLLSGDASVTSLPERIKQQQQKQPVIIYAQSPKVIHTQASDFMTLVQKLTGYSRSSDEEELAPPVNNEEKPITLDEKESSPHLVQIKGDDKSDLDLRLSPRITSQIPEPPGLYLRDIPLLTPNSMNLFLSPHSRSYMLSDSGSSMSPSVLEFMKQLSEN